MDSDLFGEYEKLLHVDLMGRQIAVPENNTLLRGLQFNLPQNISYGRFCWNGSWDNCTVTFSNGSGEGQGHACQVDACEGMRVTAVSGEIRRLL